MATLDRQIRACDIFGDLKVMRSKPAVSLLVFVTFFAPVLCEADNPRVVIVTTFGDVGVELFETDAPVTVDNFLHYTDIGFYDWTFIHRTVNTGIYVVQGGIYVYNYNSGTVFNKTPDRDPIINESYNGLSNLRGTIAMARGSGPDSATSQFYFNQSDNTQLDKANYPDGYGYCVFGKVLNGIELIDSFVQLPHADPYLVSGLTEVPVYFDQYGTPYLVEIAKVVRAPTGYWLKADINYDGIVDERDIAEVCDNWLSAAELGDIEVNGIIDFAEFAQVAQRWKWTDVWRRFTAADIDNSGAVNLRDFALLANGWKKTGLELRGDLNLDQVVNAADLRYLGEHWLETN
jgi:cyclophilin family peptidyl-prolyl cis-trans isomerase